MKRKTYGIFFLLLLLLGGACVSLGRAATQEEYVAAAGNQGLYRLDVAQGRGTIYDRNLSPLVGGKTQYVAAVAPTIEAIGALETVTQGQYREQLALALENGKLAATGTDITKTTYRLARSMCKKDTSFITVISGCDVSEEDAERTAQMVQAKCPAGIEVTHLVGGQPVYYYIISVE